MNLSKLKPEVLEQIESTFSPEQIEKIKACASLDEVFACLEDEDVVLTDEQLELVSGGIVVAGGTASC